MRIENLHEGQVIKNYKELCELLEIDIVTGNSKISQHKELERYVEYEKQGHKYKITNIYELPKEKEDNRGGNNSIFSDDFKKLIVYMLKGKKSGNLIISKGILYKTMNLVNGNYLSARNNIVKLSEIIQLPQSSIYEFYDNNSAKIRETVERNLRKCRNESILMYETVTCVAIYEAIIATNEFNKPIIDSNGRVTYTTDIKHREATEEEKHKILEIEDIIKNEMGYSSLQDIFIRGKWKIFKNRVENMLKSENTNIQYYYDGYKFIWNKYKIDELYNELCKGINKKDITTNINNNMIESIKRSTVKRHNKAIVSAPLEENKYKQKKLFERKSEEYIEEQDKLTEILIYEDYEDMSEELKKKLGACALHKERCNNNLYDDNNDIPF